MKLTIPTQQIDLKMKLGLVPLILGTLLLSACVPTPVDTAVDSTQSDAAEQSQVASVPSIDLSAEILHQLVTAELAYFRNDALTSLEILEKIAFETRDPRIAETVSIRAISQRHFDVASNTSDLWVELRPNSASAWYANAVSMVATQNFDRAVEGFQKTLSLSPDSEESTIQNIGRTLSSNLNPELAFELFERVIADVPQSLYGQLQLIQLAINAELDDSLIDGLITDGLAAQPDSDNFATVTFTLHLDRGQISEALEFAQDFLNRYPDSNRLRHNYARYLSEDGLYQEAIEHYEVLSDAESLLMQGNLYEQANFPQRSKEKYLAFHEIQPDNQRVLINLAELALDQKNYEEASVWISRITQRNLAFSRYLLTAKYIAGVRSVDEAVALLEEYGTDDNQQRIRIILVAESLYRDSGRTQQALSVLDAGLEEFPDNTTLLIAKSYTASELNLIDQVESSVNAVLATQPDNALALNALGYTLIDQTDRLEEGTRYIEKALELKPNDPYILDSMGWAHFKMGDYKNALKLLKIALSRRDDPVMAAHLGEVYWTLGRTQKAKQVWDQAIKKSPGNEILIETIERLTTQ